MFHFNKKLIVFVEGESECYIINIDSEVCDEMKQEIQKIEYKFNPLNKIMNIKHFTCSNMEQKFIIFYQKPDDAKVVFVAEFSLTFTENN